jgi:hypothetical protein
MPIRKKIAQPGPGPFAPGAGAVPARAYGGPADGRRWMVPAEELADVNRFDGAPFCAYELALNPTTGAAVRDSFGRYVYLVCARIRSHGDRPSLPGTSPGVRRVDPELRSWPARRRERTSGRYPRIRPESAVT